MRTTVLLSIVLIAIAACATSATPPPPPPPSTDTGSVPTPPIGTVPNTSSPVTTTDRAAPPPPPPSPPQAGFELQVETGQPAGGFSVVVSGLDPNELFTFVHGGPGRPGVPERRSAGAGGRFMISYDQLAPGGSCLLAKRSTGQIVRAELGIPAGASCAADVVYLSLDGSPVVRPSEFASFTSLAPAGEVIEFIGLVGPDRPLTPGWSMARVGQPPEAILFRFSPEYDRQGPLPVGRYTISYRLMGQRYDFVLTLAR